jgi:hypothetical protein
MIVKSPNVRLFQETKLSLSLFSLVTIAGSLVTHDLTTFKFGPINLGLKSMLLETMNLILKTGLKALTAQVKLISYFVANEYFVAAIDQYRRHVAAKEVVTKSRTLIINSDDIKESPVIIYK